LHKGFIVVIKKRPTQKNTTPRDKSKSAVKTAAPLTKKLKVAGIPDVQRAASFPIVGVWVHPLAMEKAP